MAKRPKKRKAVSSEVAANNTGTSADVPWLPSSLSREWVLGLILLLAVILAYQPVWYAGFIWDDDMNITANPVIIGPLGLKEIWTTGAAQHFPFQARRPSGPGRGRQWRHPQCGAGQ